MGDFGSIPLASKFGIVLGGLIVLTVTAGLIKVLFNRRRLKKATKYAEIEAARNHTEKVLQREFREGDLFGVRAIEHGFFGGVSQSRPSTPSPLSKSTTLNDTNSSVSPIRSMTPSTAKAPTTAAKHMKHKPTPLRLNPHETTSRTRNDGFKSPGHELSPIHLSPLPLKPRGSVRSLKSNGSNGEWVSPLDVHFDRPHSPTTPIKERPYSYSPRLQFPEGEVRKNPVLESNSIDLKSEAASFHSGAETVTQKNSPTFSLYPNSTHRASRSSKVVITPDGETTETRQPSRGNFRLDAIPTPPLPEGGGYFDFGIPPRTAGNQERAVIRDSVARVHRVSTYQPQRYRSQSPDTETKSRERSASDISEKGSSTVFKHSRTRTRSSETYGQIRSHKRSTSSHSITRTRDSLQSMRHSRKISEDKGNRRSRDRDQLHYDPHNHRRNRSGSVQGRVVDFDNPRVNPFVDGYATSSNQPDDPTSVSQDINHVLANRVSHMKTKVAGDISGGYTHKRTGTNESQGDIGDLVDSYYRTSDASGYGQRATSVFKRGPSRKDSRAQRGPQDTIDEFPLPVRHSRGPGFL